MADFDQPNKESVDLELPTDIVAKPPVVNQQPRETVRIQLPPRPPSDKPPIRHPIDSPPQPPPIPVPLVPAPDQVSLEPSETGNVAAVPELKKETARIPLAPEPPSTPLPSVQMKKTQPLVPMPEAEARSAAISIARTGENTSIPMPLSWTLLGVSAIILIIQIWMYFS